MLAAWVAYTRMYCNWKKKYFNKVGGLHPSLPYTGQQQCRAIGFAGLLSAGGKIQAPGGTMASAHFFSVQTLLGESSRF